MNFKLNKLTFSNILSYLIISILSNVSYPRLSLLLNFYFESTLILNFQIFNLDTRNSKILTFKFKLYRFFFIWISIFTLYRWQTDYSTHYHFLTSFHNVINLKTKLNSIKYNFIQPNNSFFTHQRYIFKMLLNYNHKEFYLKIIRNQNF